MENENKSYLFILVGAVLILAISFAIGFDKAASDAAEHVVSDFTKDLAVHTYIAGFVLVIVGCYAFLKNMYGKK